jgi:D-alanyl-D-alanine carboxypeptidase
MAKRSRAIICVLMVVGCVQTRASAAQKSESNSEFLRVDPATVIAKLKRAYPNAISETSKDTITMTSGKVLAVDLDRSPSTFDERLDQADLVDQLSITYPRGCPAIAPILNEDPGRLRYDPFFSEMYGGSAKAVTRHLTTVDWFGQKLAVTSVNGVDQQLAKVAADLGKLPDLRKYVAPSAGTYNFRVIAGTKRLSIHSYGAAIDINTKYSDYWRWNGVGKTPAYRNRIPCGVAQVFEKYGFIWGAKWYHYDTMHFEYRPELLN